MSEQSETESPTIAELEEKARRAILSAIIRSPDSGLVESYGKFVNGLVMSGVAANTQASWE